MLKRICFHLKYARLHLFKNVLVPFSFYCRKKRSKLFVEIVKPHHGMRILDVGGQPNIWDDVEIPLNITCLNLPGVAEVNHKTHHEIQLVEGDGCSMPQYNQGDFDLIFSNSVIEHVGDYKNRKLFADEIIRIGKEYWVQTPDKYFPIEAHCGMPFWWFYPKFLKKYFINGWQKKVPAWTDMINSTGFVDKNEMKELFSGSNIMSEWFIFPKSIVCYKIDITRVS